MSIKIVFLVFAGFIAVQNTSGFEWYGQNEQVYQPVYPNPQQTYSAQGYPGQAYSAQGYPGQAYSGQNSYSVTNVNAGPMNYQNSVQQNTIFSFFKKMWYYFLTIVHNFSKPLQFLVAPIRKFVLVVKYFFNPIRNLFKVIWSSIWNLITSIPIVGIPARILGNVVSVMLIPIKMFRGLIKALFGENQIFYI